MIGIWLEDCAIHFPFSFSVISLWTGRIVPLVWKELQDSPTYVKFCLYVCGWQCLFKSPGGQNLTWESLSATEEEVRRFIESLGPHQWRGCPCLSTLTITALPPIHRQPQVWPCWGQPKGHPAHYLQQWPRGHAYRRIQKQKEADSTASQSPGMSRGGFSQLASSQSLCLHISIPPE